MTAPAAAVIMGRGASGARGRVHAAKGARGAAPLRRGAGGVGAAGTRGPRVESQERARNKEG